jgi:hypothetical protein
MKFSRLRVVLLLAVAASAAVVFLSWYVNYKSIHASSQHYAQIRGQSLFHLVQMIRKWNAGHGGVYVPVTDGTPSNPYLDVPDRDITDSLGRDLTKVNPAYMTRQLSELLKGSGVEARLTSLKPLNPVNQPDEWERKALNKFENGSAEELLEVEGDNYRYMAPLYITEECLQCHAVWGYKLGDVRGGLAFSFPVSHTERLIGAQVRTATHNHLIMFFVLLVMSVSLYLSIDFFRGQLRASQERREALEAEVKEDGLTGVLNHKAVVSGLDGELKRAIRSQHKLSVLMIDLDFFKK